MKIKTMIEIKVLGTGCTNCIKLEKMCREVVSENNFEANIEKITDINEFARYAVWMTPGLVVNGKVLIQGKIPVKNTLLHWLQNEIK